MNLCVISDYLKGYHRPDLTGGAESFLDKFIAQRHKSGDQLTFITRRGPRERGRFRYGPVHTVDILDKFLPRPLANFKHRFLPIDFLSLFQTGKILRRKNFDAFVFGNFQRLSLSLLCLKAIRSKPRILMIFDYWYFCPKAFLDIREGEECRLGQGAICYRHCEPKRNPFRLPLYALRPYIFGYFLSMFDRVIVLSRHSAGVARANGIEAERIEQGNFFQRTYPPAHKPRYPNLLFLSPSYARHKGTHLLPDIIEKVRDEIPTIKCYVTNRGNACYLRMVKEMIKARDLMDSFVFLDELDEKAFRRLMRKTSIVLVPELWPNMCPATVLEGLSRRKVILTSRLGGMPEYATYSVPPTAAAFARKITAIFKRGE